MFSVALCQAVRAGVSPRSSAPASPASTLPTQATPSSWSQRCPGVRQRRRARWERWGPVNPGEPRFSWSISPCPLCPLRLLPRYYLLLLSQPASGSARAWARRVWELPWMDPRPRTPSPSAFPGAGWRKGCGPPMAMLQPLGLPLSPAHLLLCGCHTVTTNAWSVWFAQRLTHCPSGPQDHSLYHTSENRLKIMYHFVWQSSCACSSSPTLALSPTGFSPLSSTALCPSYTQQCLNTHTRWSRT